MQRNLTLTPLLQHTGGKHLSRSFGDTTFPHLQDQNSTITDPYEKANLLNNFFRDQTILNSEPATAPSLPNSTHSLPIPVINVNEVLCVLKKLEVAKASGPDDINNRLLKEMANQIAYPLTDIFNKSLVSGIFPSPWKRANVCAILKKGDPSLVNNYRPISLLSNIGKVMERIISDRLSAFLQTTSFLLQCNLDFVLLTRQSIS